MLLTPPCSTLFPYTTLFRSEVCSAGVIPIVLGGDHSIAHPDVGAVAAHLKPATLGLVHFDAHADNAPSLWGVTLSHVGDRKSTRLNSSHANISYAVFCLKKK